MPSEGAVCMSLSTTTYTNGITRTPEQNTLPPTSINTIVNNIDSNKSRSITTSSIRNSTSSSSDSRSGSNKSSVAATRTSRWGRCRKCSQQDATLAFLPCGHVVCCSECGLTVTACVVCGKGIRGSIRTDLHEHV
ncbi:baculoviral IAP repeat-containing protein 7-A-like [Haliotis cracherodii]|uniref:baculoviral IAP repeat-containing protein 7-A-like n=1 Tax=Haliotis cracherodii TaxID=6455 RepID=UPI0039E82047